MAINRNRTNNRNTCIFCNKTVFTSVVTVEENGMARVWNLCQTDYVNRTLCNVEKHEGETHSTACRYVKVGN